MNRFALILPECRTRLVSPDTQITGAIDVRRIILALTGLILATGANAQEATYPPAFGETSPENTMTTPPRTGPWRAHNVILSSVTVDDLRLLADDSGAAYLATGVSQTGAPFIFARSKMGMTYGMYAVCAGENGTDCRGVEFLAVLSSDASLEEVSKIDQSYPAVSVYRAKPGAVNVSRYVILDRGVSWGNLIENEVVFEALCARVSERLSMPEQAE